MLLAPADTIGTACLSHLVIITNYYRERKCGPTCLLASPLPTNYYKSWAFRVPAKKEGHLGLRLLTVPLEGAQCAPVLLEGFPPALYIHAATPRHMHACMHVCQHPVRVAELCSEGSVYELSSTFESVCAAFAEGRKAGYTRFCNPAWPASS